MRTEREICTKVLERIDNASGWDSGNKVLRATVEYRKDAYRTHPRGYYLSLRVFLQTDQGSQVHCLSFGDEGDPSSEFLLEETKAFSQKKFDAIQVDAVLLAARIDQMRAEYVRRRDLKQAKRQAQIDRENADFVMH